MTTTLAMDLAEAFLEALQHPEDCEVLLWKERVKVLEEHFVEDRASLPDTVRRIFRAAYETKLQRVAREMEALPLADPKEAGLDPTVRPLYFMLNMIDGVWAPAYNGEESKAGWATLGIRYEDGSTEAIPCRPGRWAHCDADGRPSMPGAWD